MAVVPAATNLEASKGVDSLKLDIIVDPELADIHTISTARTKSPSPPPIIHKLIWEYSMKTLSLKGKGIENVVLYRIVVRR